MSLKDDLLRKGYLPENLPPAFSTTKIADYFRDNTQQGYLYKNEGKPVRAAVYNASKRGMTRRIFSAVHPITAHDTALFIEDHWNSISDFYRKNKTSFSIPENKLNSDRAFVINSHAALEEEKLKRLSHYRFIACTDIARYYHTIYTHSLPWAFHGKTKSKLDRCDNSDNIYFNLADRIVQFGQDGQTVGLPVGPDSSRVFAEIVGVAIDEQFHKLAEKLDCTLIRHVDDVWIGAHTHADAELALGFYRKAIRTYELDINETKTQILSDEFRFADDWALELTTRLESAKGVSGSRQAERFRSIFEHAFSQTVRNNDDAILKYVIRQVDQLGLTGDQWATVEPFLKRTSVHFGHVIDYVARVLVWRHLTHSDLNIESWSGILLALLSHHARLGNDSEVCWTLYTCIHLGISIKEEPATDIIMNCGALAIVALLNCVSKELVGPTVFDKAKERLKGEDARGPLWPVILEWCSRQWDGYEDIKPNQTVIKSLTEKQITIFDPDARPIVFNDIEDIDLKTVTHAIENRVSLYDDKDLKRGDDDEVEM